MPVRLVDAHAHLTMDLAGTGLRGTELVEENLRLQREAGVVAVRDAGTVPGADLRSLPAGSPAVIRCGRILAPAGRFQPGLHEPVSAEELVPAALDELHAGATWVKVIADFPGPDGNWFQPVVNYEPGLLRRLAEAVHAEGGRVAAHVSGPLVREVVRAGIDSVEHGPLVDAELAHEMAERGTGWTPTLATVLGHIEPFAAAPGPMGEVIRAAIAGLRETIPLARDLGVPILAGTDEAGPGRIGLELERLVQMGLTHEQANESASSGALRFFGLPVAGDFDISRC
jgi:imidazolonepropionase-like amidohydrolase